MHEEIDVGVNKTNFSRTSKGAKQNLSIVQIIGVVEAFVDDIPLKKSRILNCGAQKSKEFILRLILCEQKLIVDLVTERNFY